MSNIDDDKTDPQATLYDEKAEEPSFLDDLRDTFAKFGVQAPQATRAAEADETPQPARNETPGTPLQLLIMMAAFCLIAVIAVGFFGKALEAKREGQKKVESSQVEQP